MQALVSLEELSAEIHDGMSLAVPLGHAGVAMGRNGNNYRQAPPISGIQANMLIGEGLVGSVESSAVTLGEAGGAPRFTEGVRAGAFRLMGATCPAILTGLIAGEKDVPFCDPRHHR